MPKDLFDKIADFDTITIFRHVLADADAIGSQFGLRYYLENKYPDKKIYCLGSNCTISRKLNVVMDEVDDETISHSLAIITDTSNSVRIDDQRYKLAAAMIRIDHHVKVETMCDDEWIDDKASAACEMIALYLASIGANISSACANMLYAGMTADNIRFTTSNVRLETFDAARYLFCQGVDLSYCDQVNYGVSMVDYRYETVVRNHAVQKEQCLYAIMDHEDYEACGLDFTDAKDKVYVLSSIDSIEVWALFTRMSDHVHYSASLRSKKLPIRQIAVDFGGGGHECASGIKNLTYDQVLAIVDRLAALSKNQ